MQQHRGAAQPAPSSNGAGASTPAQNSRRTATTVRLLLLLVAMLIAVWGIQQNPTFRERRLSRLSLADLQRENTLHPDDPRTLYYLGTRLNQQGKFTEAASALQRGLQFEPESVRLRDAWAQALVGAGQPTVAYQELKQFANSHPRSAMAQKLLGKFYFTHGAMRQANEAMSLATSLDPADGESWAFLAAARDALADPKGALDAAEKATTLRPNNAGDHLQLATFYRQGNRSAEAGREYQQVVQFAPQLAAGHREYARWLLNSAMTPETSTLAATEARKAVTLDSHDALAQLTLAQVLVRQGDLSGALAACLQAATLAPEDPAAALLLRDLYHRLGKSAESATWQKNYLARQSYINARRKLLEAIEADSNNADAHLQYAHLLAQHGDAEECLRQHAAALHAAPDAPIALTVTARDLLNSGQVPLAIAMARQLTANAGNDPNSHELLGDALLANDDSHNAAVEYQAAADIDPQRLALYHDRLKRYFDARNRRISPAEKAYREATRLEQIQIGPKRITSQVEALARQAVALEPTNPVYLEFLLHIQVAKRYNAEAVQTAQRILALKPDDSEAHALLAIILLDKASTPAELAAVEAHLHAVTEPRFAATQHYGLGLVALKRHQGAVAAQELEQAVQLDPTTEVAFYKLSQAERLAGHAQAANEAFAQYQRIQDEKRGEVQVLGDITQHPKLPAAYRRAITFFESHGLTPQAEGIRAEMKRRFGSVSG